MAQVVRHGQSIRPIYRPGELILRTGSFVAPAGAMFGPFIDKQSGVSFWLRGESKTEYEIGFNLDADAMDPEIWVKPDAKPEGISKAAWRRMNRRAADQWPD